MKRWGGKEESEDTAIYLFLEEIKTVCKKHGLSISHEGGYGAFEIEKYSEDNMVWLLDAKNKTKGMR